MQPDTEFVSSLMRAQVRTPEGRLPSLWEKVKREAKIRFRDPQQGGYVHDTATSIFLSPRQALHVGGTWTDTVGNVALTYMVRRTGAGATVQLVYDLTGLPQNTVALKGSYLKSIDVWYELGTAALTTLTPAINLGTLPPAAAATGTAFAAVVSVPITFDAFHNTNALRAAIGKHHMTITITTPVWMGPNDLNFLDTTIVDPGTAVYDDYGIRLNFTLRL